jgi:hypothetical protein
MILAADPELNWGDSYRAMTVIDQLMWDLRLRRSPARTLRHAYRTGAVPSLVRHMPREIIRRIGIRVAARGSGQRAEPPAPLPPTFDRAALDAFWSESEAVRNRS